jgi:tetratricopeptide (TPR) repeat protein
VRAVRRAAGGRAERQPAQPAPWEREAWVDDGPIRSVAKHATERARTPDTSAPPDQGNDTGARRDRHAGTGTAAGRASTGRRSSGELDPASAAEVEREAGIQRSARYQERLKSAAEALERGRFDDARRMVQPVLRDLPNVATAHEIAGLAFYSTGQWRKAATELELARQLDGSVRHHPVLADSYRALRRYDTVAELWAELKAASPAPALMAEGRIVAAGALADQGDLRGALRLLERARESPKKVREHHLRQWYVLGDLLDRSGDVIEARRFFGLVAQNDSEFADVMQRLAALGR